MFHNQAIRRRSGLSACGLGALDLTINKTTFLPGEAPGYSVSGAAISSPILWSSQKNGAPTGENLSDYGHRTDAMGVWSAPGGNFSAEQIGQWSKTVKVGDETDSVVFTVLPSSGASNSTNAPTNAPITQAAQAPGFLDGDIDLFGYKIPKVAAYGGGALALWLLLKKK